MESAPFARLFAFVHRRAVALTVAVALLQLAVLGVSLAVFAPGRVAPAKFVMEMLGPWVLLPPLRWLFRRKGLQTGLASPYAALIAGYGLVLAGLLMAVMLAFQVLNWFYAGQVAAGIFYFGSLAMVFVWASRPPRPTNAPAGS